MLYRRITAGFLPDLMQKSPRGDLMMDLALLGRQLKVSPLFDHFGFCCLLLCLFLLIHVHPYQLKFPLEAGLGG